MKKILCILCFLLPNLSSADTRETILNMENACIGKTTPESQAILDSLKVKCRPYVDHGGAKTPDALDKTSLSSDQQSVLDALNSYSKATISKDQTLLSNLLTDDFVIIQPGGNAWNKASYMKGGIAHLFAMFTDLSFDIEPIRINTTNDSATVIANFRLGGLHMKAPATTFGLGTISLVKDNNLWKIQHIHNSGMQVY